MTYSEKTASGYWYAEEILHKENNSSRNRSDCYVDLQPTWNSASILVRLSLSSNTLTRLGNSSLSSFGHPSPCPLRTNTSVAPPYAGGSVDGLLT